MRPRNPDDASQADIEPVPNPVEERRGDIFTDHLDEAKDPGKKKLPATQDELTDLEDDAKGG